MGKEYFEFRGVENGVYAEVLTDSTEGITFGAVKEFVGLAEVGKTTDSANEAHYYDNIPAIIITSTGSDEISLNTSGIPFDVLADITGQYYDQETGMFVEQERTPRYWALGYITNKSDGTKVLVWRLKGTFTIPELTASTQDDGTDASGQTMTYTGINTTYKFSKTSKTAKAVNIDTSDNPTGITETSFFSAVQTPDTIGSNEPVTGVGVIPSTLALEPEDTATLTAKITPDNAGNKAVTWESSDDTVATVSASGVVTAVADGTATITATTTDGGFTDTCAVTVDTV